MPRNNVVASLNAQVGLDATRYERGARRLNRANREIYREQQRLRREQARLTREFQNSLSAMRNSALALTALGAGFVAGVSRIASMGDELGKLSERLNISIGQLQTLQLAAESVNVPFDKIASSIQTLQVRFARLGLQTSSFRTELTALNPELLRELETVDSAAEAYRLYTERIRDLQREGRDLEALQLAQAGVGQGGAQGFLQVQRQEEQARRTLIEAGVLLSDEDSAVFGEIAQAFTDLGSVIKNTLQVALIEFKDEILSIVGLMRDLATGLVPLVAFLAGFSGLFLALARLARGGAGAARNAVNLSQVGGARGFADYFRGLGNPFRPGAGGDATAALIGRTTSAIAGLGGAAVGLDQFFRLQDSLTDRRLVQGGALGATPAIRERLRRFQRGGAAEDRLTRAQLFRLANEVYGQEQVGEILEAVGLDEGARPPAPGVLETAFGLAQPQSVQDAIRRRFERQQAEFNRQQEARVRRALRGTANVLFPPEFPAPPAAPERATPLTAEQQAALEPRLVNERILSRLSADRRTTGDRLRGAGAIGAERLRLERIDRERRERSILADLRTSREPERVEPLRVERRLRQLEEQRMLHEAHRDLARDYNREARRSVDLSRTLITTLKGSEVAIRAAFVDSILEGKLQLEDFGNILRRITAQLIDALAIQPLVSAGQSFFQQFINGFIGGGGFGGGGSNPVVNPGPGGPAGYNVPPVAAATAPPVFAPAATTAPTVNIVVNGVEDQAAFERVASRVEQTIVPTVANRLAATANRPGAARQIRGY